MKIYENVCKLKKISENVNKFTEISGNIGGNIKCNDWYSMKLFENVFYWMYGIAQKIQIYEKHTAAYNCYKFLKIALIY